MEKKERFYLDCPFSEKDEATEKLDDKWNHVIFPGELYLKGHLVKTHSKSHKKNQFCIVNEPVLIQPGEVFKFCLDIDEQLTMDTLVYGELVERVNSLKTDFFWCIVLGIIRNSSCS